MKPETKKAILTIIDNEDEIESVQYLLRKIENDMHVLQKSVNSNRACLKAIKKINEGKNIDIDSLCE